MALNALVIQSDGKIVVGGAFSSTLNSESFLPYQSERQLRPVTIRLVPGAGRAPDGIVFRLALEPDGTILAAGFNLMVSGESTPITIDAASDGPAPYLGSSWMERSYRRIFPPPRGSERGQPIDASFQPSANGGRMCSAFPRVLGFVTQADGRIVGGNFMILPTRRGRRRAITSGG